MTVFKTTFYFLIFGFFFLSTHQCHASSEIDSLKQQLKKDISPESRLEILLLLGNRYQTQSLDSALLFGKTALTIAENESFQDSVFINVHNLLGRTYMNIGVYDKAITHYLTGIKLAETLTDKTLYSKLMINLSIVYFRLSDFDKSENILHEAITLIQKYSSTKEFPNKNTYLSSAYNNLAIIYENKRDTIKIMQYYDTALMHSMANNDQRNIALILNNIGNIQLNQQKFDVAFENITKSLKIRIEQNDQKGAVQNYDNLGRYYSKLEQWDSAVYYFRKGIEASQAVGSLTDIISLHRGLGRAFEKTGQFELALDEQKYFTALSDSLYNLQRAMEIAKIEASFEFERQQAQDQMEQRKRNFRFYLLLTVSFCLTLVIGLWIILYLRYQKKSLESEHQAMSQSLEYKNKEMATKTLYQYKKDELINHVIPKLKELVPELNDDQKASVHPIIKSLEESTRDETWAEFEVLFNETHQDFYKSLEQHYPDLTLNERRLCAFLKLNMTSKEISALTGQSVRSIVVARSRLRKKLSLTHVDTNLNDFFKSI